MTTPSSRTFTHAAVILGVGLFALGGVSRVPPLRSLERQAVKALAESVDPVDAIIDGTGSQKEPWTRRKASPPADPPPPRFLAIDDDPDGWFASSPLSPIDHATIFARLHDAGHTVIGVGHLMAWEEPEALAMEALRIQLDKFDATVLGLPLARGAAAEPVPAPFLRMSIDESEVKGDLSPLPQVNRVAVPNAELGGELSLAGFSLLENEPDPGDGRQHLLARWGDRVLFAFPLATEIAGLGLDPADVVIAAGKEIRLGGDGPVIAIDEFGRTAVPPETRSTDVPAMRLISEKDPIPPSEHPLLTRDVRPDLPEAERAWSDHLARAVQALRSAPKYQPAVTLPRPDALVELLLIAGLAVFATWSSRLRTLPWRIIAALGVIGLSVEVLYLLAARQDLWLPPLAMLAPGIVGLGLSFAREKAEVETDVRPLPQAPDAAPPTPPVSEPAAARAAEQPLQQPSAMPDALPPVPAEVAGTPPPADTPDSAPPPEKKAGRKTAKKAAKKAAKKTAKKAAKKTARKAVKKSARKSAKESDDAE